MSMADDKFLSPFDRWLWTNRMTGADVARKLGVNRATVSQWRTKHHAPPEDMRRRIAKLTKGAVTEQDWDLD